MQVVSLFESSLSLSLSRLPFELNYDFSFTTHVQTLISFHAHPEPTYPHGLRAPRATWIQTELFLTFPNPILRSITLMPLNAPETGGRFRVWVDVGKGKGDELAWDRKVRLDVFTSLTELSIRHSSSVDGQNSREADGTIDCIDGRRFPRVEGFETEDKEFGAA